MDDRTEELDTLIDGLYRDVLAEIEGKERAERGRAALSLAARLMEYASVNLLVEMDSAQMARLIRLAAEIDQVRERVRLSGELRGTDVSGVKDEDRSAGKGKP